jgi:hypothetical protein
LCEYGTADRTRDSLRPKRKLKEVIASSHLPLFLSELVHFIFCIPKLSPNLNQRLIVRSANAQRCQVRFASERAKCQPFASGRHSPRALTWPVRYSWLYRRSKMPISLHVGKRHLENSSKYHHFPERFFGDFSSSTEIICLAAAGGDTFPCRTMSRALMFRP